VFTHTLDTVLSPVVVEFHPAGWCVAMDDVNVVERLSFDEQRALCVHADEIQDSPAARASFAADRTAPGLVNVATGRRKSLVAF
jgi:hypothetical protein